MSTKTFTIGQLLSMTTGVLLGTMDDIYAVADHIGGGGVTTIGLLSPRWPEAILEQFPALKDAPKFQGPKEQDFSSRDEFRLAMRKAIDEYLQEVGDKFGHTFELKSDAA